MHNLFEIPSITLFLCALCAFLWLKNPRLNISSCSSCLRGEKIREISVNPWLINYFCALGIFTSVKDSLQISSFMQNEPNFRKSQMNVNNVLTRDYDKKDTWSSGKNEPKTNPIYPCVASGEAGTNPITKRPK